MVVPDHEACFFLRRFMTDCIRRCIDNISSYITPIYSPSCRHHSCEFDIRLLCWHSINLIQFFRTTM